jgi:hypothetical protein
MLRTSQKTIDGFDLELEVFGTTQNLTLTASFLKLLKVDTETVFAMLNAKDGDQTEKTVLMIDTILSLINKIDLETVFPVLKDLVSKVKHNNITIDFDEFFAGDNELLAKVIMWVTEENRFFGKSFISKMQTLATEIKQENLKKLSEEQTQS